MRNQFEPFIARFSTAIVLLFVVDVGMTPAQLDTDWSKIYLSDLETTKAAIAANHPGMVDKQNLAG